jgi:hypothetical protein
MMKGKALRTEGWLMTSANDLEKPWVLQGLKAVPVGLPSLSTVPGTVAKLVLLPTVAGTLSDPWGAVITPLFIVAIAAAMLVFL